MRSSRLTQGFGCTEETPFGFEELKMMHDESRQAVEKFSSVQLCGLNLNPREFS